jgi:hypothetical protein
MRRLWAYLLHISDGTHVILTSFCEGIKQWQIILLSIGKRKDKVYPFTGTEAL